MSKYGGADVEVLLVDGYNLIPSVILSLDGPVLSSTIQETTGLGVTWKQHTATGIRSGSVSIEGYFDDETTGTCAALAGQEGTSRIVTIPFHRNVLGSKVFCASGAFGAKWARQSKVDDLQRARADFTLSGTVDDDAVLLHPLTTITGDTNTEGASSQDNGASTANGAAAYLHVLGYAGFTNLVAKVRHSSDDVSYADLITFTTITASGAQRATVAGTVNRHLAVDLNVTGSGSLAVLVALKRL